MHLFEFDGPCYNNTRSDTMHKEHLLIPHFHKRLHVTYCYNPTFKAPMPSVLLVVDSDDGNANTTNHLAESLTELGFMVCLYDVAHQDFKRSFSEDITQEIKTLLMDMRIQPDCDHHALSIIATDQPAGWLLCHPLPHLAISKVVLFNAVLSDQQTMNFLSLWKQPLLLIHDNPSWLLSFPLKHRLNHVIAIKPNDSIKMICEWLLGKDEF